jgi:hypothetical protein
MQLFDLSNDVAVVIGATGVLGGAIAEGLAKAGARVAILGRSAERGEARVAEIRKSGGTAQFFSADVSKRENLKRAHDEVRKALGAPTILLNAECRGRERSEGDSHARAGDRANRDGRLAGEFRFESRRRSFGSVPGIRSGDVREWPRVNYQYRERFSAFAVVAGGRLFRGESGGAELHPVSCARMGAERRARKFDHAGIFSGRAKSRAAVQSGWITDAARAIDLRPHADETVWPCA